jgi:hypothetical protein
VLVGVAPETADPALTLVAEPDDTGPDDTGPDDAVTDDAEPLT